MYFDVVWNIKYNFEKFNVKDIFEKFKNCSFERKIEYFYNLSCILYELRHLKECIYLWKTVFDFDSCKYKYLVCRALVHILKIYIENIHRDKLKDFIENALNLSI